VLLELRSKKTGEKIAEELHCSPKTITNRCKELRISDEDVKKYAAEKSKVNGGTVR
jgi:biotin operon repressor